MQCSVSKQIRFFTQGRRYSQNLNTRKACSRIRLRVAANWASFPASNCTLALPRKQSTACPSPSRMQVSKNEWTILMPVGTQFLPRVPAICQQTLPKQAFSSTAMVLSLRAEPLAPHSVRQMALFTFCSKSFHCSRAYRWPLGIACWNSGQALRYRRRHSSMSYKLQKSLLVRMSWNCITINRGWHLFIYTNSRTSSILRSEHYSLKSLLTQPPSQHSLSLFKTSCSLWLDQVNMGRPMKLSCRKLLSFMNFQQASITSTFLVMEASQLWILGRRVCYLSSSCRIQWAFLHLASPSQFMLQSKTSHAASCRSNAEVCWPLTWIFLTQECRSRSGQNTAQLSQSDLCRQNDITVTKNQHRSNYSMMARIQFSACRHLGQSSIYMKADRTRMRALQFLNLLLHYKTYLRTHLAFLKKEYQSRLTAPRLGCTMTQNALSMKLLL